jgi:hypothetical protein
MAGTGGVACRPTALAAGAAKPRTARNATASGDRDLGVGIIRTLVGGSGRGTVICSLTRLEAADTVNGFR